MDYNTSTPKTSPEHQGIIAALSMTYHSILVLTRTALFTTESCYDAYEPAFAKIISHAPVALAGTAADTGNQPPFIFDMGTWMSLFITVLKCRSPSIAGKRSFICVRHRRCRECTFRIRRLTLAALVAVEESGPSCEVDLMLGSVLGRAGRVPLESERVFRCIWFRGGQTKAR
ncbi:hypothetical protein BDV12DRAFT_203234 [Aspergillus spectabilis]